MKIIGEMDRILTVQMSVDEFADITGLRVDRGQLIIGTSWRPIHTLTHHEFAIRDGWSRLHAINQNRPELQKCIRQLRAIADVLEPLELVVCPEEEEASKAGVE